MSENVNKNCMPLKVLVNFSRVLLGLTFLFSGVVKAIDPVGTQIKLSDYLYAFGMGDVMLDSTLLILACLLAGFEILIGSYLLVGVFNRGTSLLALVMMVVFTPFTLYLAIKNPVRDCGCFGDALVLTNWQTFYKNLFLLVLAVLVFIKRNLIVPFVAEKRYWVITLIVSMVAIRFMTANINGLPVLDFRPYKVGTDLRKEILENTNPAMSDFSVMDADMNDITADILTDSSFTFLLVSPFVENASENNLDLIDDVFDYCSHYGYNIIGLTSSGDDAIKQWTENAGAEIPFLFCDEIPLKTMVRSNPGLILLKNGVLVNKWGHARIPSDEELSGPLDEIQVGQVPPADPFRTPWAVCILFVLPLLLVVLIDKLKGMIQ
jgi:triosephosphate isomerase